MRTERERKIRWKKEDHECPAITTPDLDYGPAITEILESEDGEFWATNGEYTSQINYCPWCGLKAPKQIENALSAAPQPHIQAEKGV